MINTFTTYSFLFSFLVFTPFYSTLIAQEKAIRLIEEKLKKRTILYVQNDADSDKSVFLKINPTGYRRRAQRPVLKIIPAKTKVQMMILIPLTDVPSSYTYTLIVNDKLETMEIDRSKEPKKEAPLSSILRSEIIIFTKENCKKCTSLITKLQQKHIQFREVNINSRSRYLEYLWELLEQKGYTKNTVQLPLSLKKGKLIHPISNLDSFTSSITKE